MDEAERVIQAELHAAKLSALTPVDAGKVIIAYERWQLELGTWLETLARTHAPNIPRPSISALPPQAFPIDALAANHESVEATEQPRRRTLIRLKSTEEPTTAAVPSVVTPTSPDASRIKPSSYAIRPFSAKKQQPLLPIEPTFSLVHGNVAPANKSMFPTLVQANAVPEIAPSTSIIAALPTAAASPVSPVVAPAASHFTPLAAISQPVPPTAAKSSHSYPQPIQPSARTVAVKAIQALVTELEKSQGDASQLQTKVHRLEEQLREQTAIAAAAVAVNATPPPTVDTSATASATASGAVTPRTELSTPSVASIPPTPTASATSTITCPLPAVPRQVSIASRPAFVVSTSAPQTPLSLGSVPVPASTKAAPVQPQESYQARIARESEARRLAKEAEKAATLAAAQAIAAAEAEKERKRREAQKALLAQQKAAKAEVERLKAEAEENAAKAQKQKEKEAAAARKAQKEKDDAAKAAKAKDQEAAAEKDAAEKKKAKRATMNKEDAKPHSSSPPESRLMMTAVVSPVVDVSSVVFASTAAISAIPLFVPPPAAAVVDPTPPAAATPITGKPKKSKALPIQNVDCGSQTDFAPDSASTEAYIAKRFGAKPTQAELDEEAQEQAELARLSLKDQVEKLKLDQRYSKIRIRGLDEETQSQLKRIQAQKDELSKQAFIIQQQNAELAEWRLEANKLVSTGLPKEDAKTAAATAEPEADRDPPVPSSSSNPLVTLPPPSSLHAAITSNPAYLAWLRGLFDQLQALDARRKQAERMTAETIEMGRKAEMNLLEVWKENERLHAELDMLKKKK